MARGASAAKAPMVVSADSSYPIEQIAEAAKTTLWYQVYLDGETRGNGEAIDYVAAYFIALTLQTHRTGLCRVRDKDR